MFLRRLFEMCMCVCVCLELRRNAHTNHTVCRTLSMVAHALSSIHISVQRTFLCMQHHTRAHTILFRTKRQPSKVYNNKVWIVWMRAIFCGQYLFWLGRYVVQSPRALNRHMSWIYRSIANYLVAGTYTHTNLNRVLIITAAPINNAQCI